MGSCAVWGWIDGGKTEALLSLRLFLFFIEYSILYPAKASLEVEPLLVLAYGNT